MKLLTILTILTCIDGFTFNQFTIGKVITTGASAKLALEICNKTMIPNKEQKMVESAIYFATINAIILDFF